MKKILLVAIFLALAVAVPGGAQTQAKDGVLQSEKEFQEIMPITGTVETYFGNFKLDHSFPAVGEADKIYDLIDHQRAAQLYLWGIPFVGMTRWHEGYEKTYKEYDYNTLLYVDTFNERRGVLTANETTDYYWGFGNTRDGAVLVDIPEGVTVGFFADMWQQGFTDIGIFGPNAGRGGSHAIVGPNTPADKIPGPADDLLVHHSSTEQFIYVMRMIGTPEEVKALSGQIKIYNNGQKPALHLMTAQDKFVANYMPRGLDYWKLLHLAINKEVVQERDRLFMYWLRDLGIEKDKPFNPTDEQIKIPEDGAKVG